MSAYPYSLIFGLKNQKIKSQNKIKTHNVNKLYF